MKCGFSLLAIVIILLSACQKKDSAGTSVTAAKAASVIQDSVKQDSTIRVSSYPRAYTYTGQYNEYNADISPYNYSGTSTVTITYVNKYNIIIGAQSLGIPRGSLNYDDVINVPTPINDSNTYTFRVQWYSDRWDGYICKLSNDSLVCEIDQTAGGAEYDDYTGTFRGYIEH